ncbi:hypothetical protein HLK59_17800 [Streptomyces sp. S3(2020)]|uniref:hypothetical protein n=1 Tax=Streptomyces sp. S3(2020) TaxID=2732044 RepID=UPI00148965D9|nr:hypothetical protein [Streptomyces sp. S3(2020)]NNN32182.1 hypothetical protein [Streptomyces sp. S3(2020)]
MSPEGQAVNPADHGRQPLDAAAALRGHAAQTRVRADQFAAVLEDIAANGLPDPEQCTPWEDLHERHLVRLARPAVA